MIFMSSSFLPIDHCWAKRKRQKDREREREKDLENSLVLVIPCPRESIQYPLFKKGDLEPF